MMVGEGWFRTLIEAAPDIYFRYDFVPLRRFAYVSPAIKTAIGYAPDDFCRDPAFCVGLVAREDRHWLRQIVRARRGLTVTLRLTGCDGAVVTFDVRTAPLIRRGRMVAVEGVARRADVPSAFGPPPDAEPVQQRLTALLCEVHDLLHRALPAGVGVAAARPASVFEAGDVRLDPERLTVTLAGSSVALTSRELLALRYFFQHADRIVTREQLLSEVWGYRYTGDARTVDVHVSRLRRKLPPLAARLVAVKNIGYRLDLRPAAREHIANF